MNNVINPFGDETPGSTALASVERREEAEVMAMVAVAKRFPRDPRAACAKILNAFARPSLADEAVFSYSRGGTDISDLTIRAAEAIAAEWGNIQSGWREVSRGLGPTGVPFSHILAFAWDLESTNRKDITFMVPHWRDRKNGGGYVLKEERDIYELCANMAQRRLRSCIMALLPGDVKEMARTQAETTLNTHAQVTPEVLRTLLEKFEPFGVTKEHIVTKIQRDLESMAPAQLVQMRKIYRSLMEGMSKPGDWFDVADDAPKGAATSLEEIKKAAEIKPAATPAPSPAPAADAPAGPATDTPPGMPTAEELKAKMTGARKQESLDVHADWIRHFKDEAVRMNLNEVYEACTKKLSGGGA